MLELVLPAKTEYLNNVIDFVNEKVDRICSNPTERALIDIVVEEIFTNISSYAYKKDQMGKVKLQVEINMEQKQMLLRFEDQGIPYNPLQREDPDPDVYMQGQKIGGLGIAIVKKSVDEIHYEYKDHRNILTMKKKMDV